MTNEELATAIQAGDNDLMEQLWKQCFCFIRQQAIKSSRAFQNRPDFDVDDLTQAGYIALCEAVRCFQEGRGGFINFLSFYLKTEFAKVAGFYTEKQKKDPIKNAVRLDAPAYNDADNETTIGESIPVYEQGFDDVEESLFNQQLSVVLDQAMEQLPEKQRRAIELYYLHGKTYAQIAEIWNCSKNNVREHSDTGLRNIKNGEFAPTLSEILYGDRNYYKHTGFTSWKYSGSSSPEWELLKKENSIWWRNIRRCVDRLGMTMEQAKRLFPA